MGEEGEVMRTVLYAFLCLAFLLQPASANDLLGWQQTRWGMTEAQAAAAVTDATRVSPPEKYSGMYAPMKARMEVSGSEVEVMLQFSYKTKTLSQVLLKPRFGGLETWAKFRDLLTSRYGASTQVGKKREWKFKTTVVELSHLQIPGVIDQVSIRYFPTANYRDDKQKL